MKLNNVVRKSKQLRTKQTLFVRQAKDTEKKIKSLFQK